MTGAFSEALPPVLCQRSNLASTFTIVPPPTMRGELPLYALKTEWAYERPTARAPMA